ncbi:NXPE family member 3-like [Saccoglossus kowalevskii]|uniref:NXPE family member 3-like n=1 Tax=Saccoglossus kowalevskii TaxID=10224 RepID=A0ABM0MRI2_SACKO|nr:PREDICTED: NXPE family member 3-like [Saccoglossus kowalevskii]
MSAVKQELEGNVHVKTDDPLSLELQKIHPDPDANNRTVRNILPPDDHAKTTVKPTRAAIHKLLGNVKEGGEELLFPYIEYDRFAMEWVNVVDELEWVHKNSNDKSIHTSSSPFEFGIGTLTPTSANKTRLKIQGDKNKLVKGSYISVLIETRDDNDRKRIRGGDFFTAVMTNTALKKSTAGRIKDYGNGTYAVYFYAAWSGQAHVTIKLSYTREAINYLKDTMKTKEGLMGFDANFTNGKISESSRCSLINEGVWHNMCEYTNANSLGKTVLLCIKPLRLECSDLYSMWTGVGNMNNDIKKEGIQSTYLFDGQYNTVQLKQSPLVINILDHPTPVPPPKLLPCGPDVPRPLSDGYWDNNVTFVPLVCQSKQWSKEEFNKCMFNKQVTGIGDSTLRQFFSFADTFGFNISDFHVLALRIAGEIVSIWKPMFAADLIDNITQKQCDTKTQVVILNFSFHYGRWSIRSYVERVFRAKLASERLLQRCPNSKVIIKLAHARDNNWRGQNIHSNNWLYYDMNRIIRRVFGGIGVVFLDVWDMVDSSFDENQVHMSTVVMRQELYLLLSYICPEMASLK